jgi:hypothetical protein
MPEVLGVPGLLKVIVFCVWGLSIEYIEKLI